MSELTPAEKTFFESGGSDDKGLLAENKELVADPAPPEEAPAVIADPAPKVEAKPDEAKVKAEKDARRKAAIEEFNLVDFGAVTETRAEAKELRRQNAEFQAWKQQVEPLLAQLKPKEGNPYNQESQPVEHANYEWQALQTQVKTLSEGRQRDEQTRQAQERNNQVLNWGANQEREFIKSQPDYAEAAAFARESRDKQLAVFYPDPNQRAQIINMEIAQIISQSADATLRGMPTNPAQKAYEFAIANGYKVKAKETPSTEVVETIQRGQQASGGLNGGAAPKGAKISAEELARMPTNTPAQKKAWQKAWEECYG